MEIFPKAVIVLSGKRKSGKDYVAGRLQKMLDEEKCAILRLSAPLKKQYALEHGLDFEKLLDASDYKEQFRADMIQWGEDKRNKDPGYFCRLTTMGDDAKVNFWLVSDARRKTDIDYFRHHFNDCTLTIRLHASKETRIRRGFVFTKGVDDAESECGLDMGVDWDFIIHNNGDQHSLQKDLDNIVEQINFIVNHRNR